MVKVESEMQKLRPRLVHADHIQARMNIESTGLWVWLKGYGQLSHIPQNQITPKGYGRTHCMLSASQSLLKYCVGSWTMPASLQFTIIWWANVDIRSVVPRQTVKRNITPERISNSLRWRSDWLVSSVPHTHKQLSFFLIIQSLSLFVCFIHSSAFC